MLQELQCTTVEKNHHLTYLLYNTFCIVIYEFYRVSECLRHLEKSKNDLVLCIVKFKIVSNKFLRSDGAETFNVIFNPK